MRVTMAIIGMGFLAACQPTPPDDGAQYFDNITPDPTALQREETRLADAETSTPETVLPPTATASTGDISNTQDFTAITQSETIESDAEKLAALKENYEQAPTEALPQRTDQTNIAAYALAQPHAVGTKKFRRINIGISNCRRYRDDPDAAQREFLKAGGPERDPKRLDPDGDGFACTWNPETYRRLLRASRSG